MEEKSFRANGCPLLRSTRSQEGNFKIFFVFALIAQPVLSFTIKKCKKIKCQGKILETMRKIVIKWADLFWEGLCG